LRRFFEDIPDAKAIGKIANLEWGMPAYPPLMLDGLISLNVPEKLLPLDSKTLDYRGPWTSWKGGVKTSEKARRSEGRRHGVTAR
jgi:hypothetical protein